MGGLLVGRSRHVVWLWASVHKHAGAWNPRGKVEVAKVFPPSAAVAKEEYQDDDKGCEGQYPSLSFNGFQVKIVNVVSRVAHS